MGVPYFCGPRSLHVMPEIQAFSSSILPSRCIICPCLHASASSTHPPTPLCIICSLHAAFPSQCKVCLAACLRMPLPGLCALFPDSAIPAISLPCALYVWPHAACLRCIPLPGLLRPFPQPLPGLWPFPHVMPEIQAAIPAECITYHMPPHAAYPLPSPFHCPLPQAPPPAMTRGAPGPKALRRGVWRAGCAGGAGRSPMGG